MFTKDIQETLDQALQSLHLSIHAQKVYKVLIEKGKLRVKMIASVSEVRRELCYKALEELENAGFVKKEDPESGVSLFEPVHPEVILEKLKNNSDHLVSLEETLKRNISVLANTYNKSVGLPYVESQEGIEGFRNLYKDINASEESDIKLFRSPLDIKHPEIHQLITEQIEYQRKNGIRAKVLTSFTFPSLKDSIEIDKINLVERRIIQNQILNIPAQIIIYGNKVGITSFDGPLITTIIDNQAIKMTFEIIFDFLFSIGKTTKEIIKKSPVEFD